MKLIIRPSDSVLKVNQTTTKLRIFSSAPVEGITYSSGDAFLKFKNSSGTEVGWLWYDVSKNNFVWQNLVSGGAHVINMSDNTGLVTIYDNDAATDLFKFDGDKSLHIADSTSGSVANPASGYHLLRANADGFYVRDSAGTEGRIVTSRMLPGMVNGKLSVTVASNNLTVAIKTLAGNDPSTSDPVCVMIGTTVRTISAALSVTLAAATNWMNAGGAELATKEIDYFAYLGYNATDGVVLGVSRVPYGCIYGDFSATSTAETYCAISTITHAAAGDDYVVVGRFAATLSGGAGYTWTVPTFTSINLVQRPIYETRWLDWTPAPSCSGSLTYSTVTYTYARYKIIGRLLWWEVRSSGTLGGSASNYIYATVPLEAAKSADYPVCGSHITAGVSGNTFISPGTPDKFSFGKYDVSNYTTSGTCIVLASGFYEI